MPICNKCGGQIIFRYIDGSPVPIHTNGECSSSRTHKSNNRGKLYSGLSYESYVNPHAICPVCGEEIFFYQSPSGGRVFFDSLGPPWPKHPCTTNIEIARRVIITKPTTKGKKTKSEPWKKEGWAPLSTARFESIHNGTYVRLKLEYKGENIALFFLDIPNLPLKSLFQIRKQGEECFELSALNLSHANKGEIDCRFLAYKSLLRAKNSISRPQVSDRPNATKTPPKIVDKEACPYCSKKVRCVTDHVSQTHPEKWGDYIQNRKLEDRFVNSQRCTKCGCFVSSLEKHKEKCTKKFDS